MGEFSAFMLLTMLLSVNLSVLQASQAVGRAHYLTSPDNASDSKWSIKVDKRLELLTAVQLFTDWANTGIWKQNYTYKNDMMDFFKPYSGHQAMTIFSTLLESGFSYDAPVGFMMHLSDPPELMIIEPFSEYLINRASNAGGISVLEQFTEALRSFALESSFEEFWASHQLFYSYIERTASTSIPLENTVRTLEEYFGISQHGYYVALAPLFLGSYGYHMEANGSLTIYAMLGPQSVAGDVPLFGAALFHEFAHSFVNPLTEEFVWEFENPERLYRPIETQMRNMAYGHWTTMINEHIIRAVEIKLTGRAKALSQEERRGFIYIRPLYDLLSEYNRTQYRSFREFYPEIVNLFNNIPTQSIPFIETLEGKVTVGLAVLAAAAVFIFLRKRKPDISKVGTISQIDR